MLKWNVSFWIDNVNVFHFVTAESQVFQNFSFYVHFLCFHPCSRDLPGLDSVFSQSQNSPSEFPSNSSCALMCQILEFKRNSHLTFLAGSPPLWSRVFSPVPPETFLQPACVLRAFLTDSCSLCSLHSTGPLSRVLRRISVWSLPHSPGVSLSPPHHLSESSGHPCILQQAWLWVTCPHHI